MAQRTRRTHRRAARIQVATIVEGEIDAVPVLLRRVAEDAGLPPIVTPKPVLASRGDFQTRQTVERLVKAAAIKIENRGAIFLLFDSDGVCPAKCGPEVLGWATKAAAGLPIAVVLAQQEYEAWLLAGASTLGGTAGLTRGIKPPSNPEGIAKAKEWLSDHMEGHARYSPPRHQSILTERFNLREARGRAESFEKCCRDIRRLITELMSKEPAS